jgi:hypothetical protein
MKRVARWIAPTPLGPNWGWRERTIEIASLPIHLVALPFVWIHRGMTWVAEKVWNS